jgi:hypothetical protein
MIFSNDKRDTYKNIWMWFLKVRSYKLISYLKKNGVAVFETFNLWCHPESRSHRISVTFSVIFIQKAKTYPSFDRVTKVWVTVWKPQTMEPVRWRGSLFCHMQLLKTFFECRHSVVFQAIHWIVLYLNNKWQEQLLQMDWCQILEYIVMCVHLLLVISVGLL